MEASEKFYDDRFRVMDHLVYLRHSYNTEQVYFESKDLEGTVKGEIVDLIIKDLLKEGAIKLAGSPVETIRDRRVIGVECLVDLRPRLFEIYNQWNQWYKENGCHVPESKKLPNPDNENMFRKEGDLWTISFEGKPIPLKNTKGLSYLQYILRHRDNDAELPALVVKHFGQVEARQAAGVHNRTIGQAIQDGVNIDSNKNAYSAIWMSISPIYEKIKKDHPALFEHLHTYVGIGLYCSYTPPKETPQWKF